MRKLLYITISLICGFSSIAQEIPSDSTAIEVEYYLIEGDTIPRSTIDLAEVIVFKRLKFDNTEERRRYLILRRKTRKVFPYAKLAAERLVSLNERLENIDSNREKKRYTKIIHKYLEGEFAAELKKLTKTEGQILIKLIHRQTGETTFELVKRLRNGWRAFWYNTTASAFDISMKEEYDPVNVREDYLIEDILQRSFQSKILEAQPTALDFDFLQLEDKWKVEVIETN